jgi:hypothetical protein
MGAPHGLLLGTATVQLPFIGRFEMMNQSTVTDSREKSLKLIMKVRDIEKKSEMRPSSTKPIGSRITNY